MKKDLFREFETICNTKVAMAGYTSGLCGEWTEERFKNLGDQLGVEISGMVMANQKHTDQVSVVKKEDAGYGIIRPHGEDYADAMITAQTGIMLCIHTADCVPVVLFDPVKRVIGIAHSGWVGSSKHIAGKTLKKMIDEYHSRPEDVICAIGPYNHFCCYEVGEDVHECFREAFSETECRILFKKTNNEGKYMLDLGSAVKISLCQTGAKQEKIYDVNCCTYHTESLPSWRRTGDRKKQILTYIMLK